MPETPMHLSGNDSILLSVFEAVPTNSILLLPDAPHYTIVAVTVGMMARSGLAKGQLVGKPFFEPFPANPSNPGDPNIKGQNITLESFDHVIKYKELHQLPVFRYDLDEGNGVFTELYWNTYNNPVLDGDGNVIYILHTSEDVTEKIKVEQQDVKMKGMKEVNSIFRQAPMAIQIFKGRELVITLANDQTLTLWGREGDIIGKRLLDVLPELTGSGYDEMMYEVMRTGEPKSFYETLVVLNKAGIETEGYYNFVYNPYYEDDIDNATGVLVFSYEVTEQVQGKKNLAESEHSLRLAIEISDLGTFRVDVAKGMAMCSPQIMTWFGLDQSYVPLATIFSKIYTDDKAIAEAAIQQSLEEDGAGRHDVVYRLNHPQTGQLQYLRSIGQVQKEAGVPVYIAGVLQDVTEQIISRQQLEEKEADLLRLFEEAPVSITIVSADDNLRFLYANAAYCQLTGRRPQDLIGIPMLEAMPELMHQGFDVLLKNVLATGLPFTATELPVNVLRAGTLEQVYLDFTYQPRKNAAGRVTGILVVATNVTQQVAVRKNIEESEARFRSLIEEAPVATCLFVGRDMVIEIANQQMIEVWGKGRSLLGKPLAKALPELVGQHFLPLLDELYTTGKTYEAKGGRADLAIDGELRTFYFDYTFKPLRNTAGEVYAILEMAVDVTKEVTAKRALEKSEENLRNMILQAPIAMGILRGPRYVMELANERLCELCGRSREELTGKPMFEALPEVRDQGYEELLNNVYTTGNTFSAFGIPVTLPRQSGIETVYINLLYEAFREGDGIISGIMVVASDVTEQVLARQKIEAAVADRTKELAEVNESLNTLNKELKRSNANLEEFAHAASHDLKEPVRKIHYFTEHLKELLGTSLNDAEVRAFSRISSATERMGNLIDDLLLYSHVSLRPHETEAVNLNVKVQRVLEDLELDVQEKGALIHVGALPVVQGYRRQLQQLFQNLISNALKYSKHDEPPRIDITASEVTEQGVRFNLIKIKDNGIGFEQHYEEKIFQMFSRLHGKGEYSGTGVGLSIVKKVVENHNGFIRVESVPGAGATFLVYLPVAG